MDNYAIYLRKSRADIELEAIEKMETLKRHKKILMELAHKKHLHIAEVYEEIVSGETIADRPEMQRLLNDVYKKKYKGVLVVEVERLARGDTRDQGEVVEAFKYSNTLIVTPTKTYDPNNQFDEEYFEFGLFMSRREYKTIQRRLNTGKIESVKEGNYIGSIAPFGYDKLVRGRKDRTLIPNDKAPYVKRIFEMYANEKISCTQIALKMTQMGIPTLKGKKEWHRGTIREILVNEIYIGKVYWTKRKEEKVFDGNKMAKKSRRKKDSYLIVDGKHEAIVSEELFYKAKERMKKSSSPVNVKKSLVNPLAALLRCSKCGKNLGYQSYKNRSGQPRFVHVDPQYCQIKSSSVKDVMIALTQSLENIIEDFEIKLKNGQNAHDENILPSLEKELASSISRKDELMEYFERKIYSLEEFLNRKDKLTKRIESLKNQIEEEKTKAKKETNYEEKIITFQKAIKTLNDENISVKEKNDFLKEIIDYIDYDIEDLGAQRGGIIKLDVHLK